MTEEEERQIKLEEAARRAKAVAEQILREQAEARKKTQGTR